MTAAKDEGKELQEQLERFSAEQAQADAERAAGRSVLEAKARAEATQVELREAKRQLKSAVDDRDAMARELSLYMKDYTATPDWLKSPKSTDKTQRATLLGMLSDTHYGEVVDASQMDGYNAYNPDIAVVRSQRFFERTIRVARHYLTGVEYDGYVLVLGGDLVSGSIHDELLQTNELTIYESIEFALAQLIKGVEMLADEFTNLLVVSVPGNHGRTTRKPQAKNYSADNADSHIARLLASHFAGTSIEFNVPDSTDADFSIYDWKFSAEHGHDFKQAGSPEIGSIGPIMRGTLRKGARKLGEGKPIDYNLLGHFHQFIDGAAKGFMSNGSVKGYDEYARSGNFKPERPQQLLASITPEFGVTTVAPVFVADRGEEGW